MNENIDLTKILKNCPEGYEFYSSYFGKVTFVRISYGQIIVGCPKIHRQVVFNTNGKYVMLTYTDNNGNYLLSNECLLFPSKDQRDWSKFTAPWYKKEEEKKFDPKTLHPYDKVLVRDGVGYKWNADFYSYRVVGRRHSCVDDIYDYCIPYNDDTKHLLGTSGDAPDFYRYWED